MALIVNSAAYNIPKAVVNSVYQELHCDAGRI